MKALILTIVAVIAFKSPTATAQTLKHVLGTPNGLLRFEENRGQVLPSSSTAVDGDVDYVLRSKGMTVYFTQTGVTYQWDRQELTGSAAISEATGKPLHESIESIQSRTVRMSWINSNPQTELLADQANNDYTNYYLEHCREGILGVRSYNRLSYKNIYPGVEVVYFIEDEKLKYDVVFHPGANLSDYQFEYIGSLSASVVNQQIKIRTRHGELTEDKISASFSNGTDVQLHYQLIEGSRFTFGSTIGLETSPGNDLIVDPFVYWSSFFGGSSDEAGTSITSNSSGNSFATGYTASLGSSLAYNGYQGTHNGGAYDSYLVKFDAFGNRLWSTYYGGSGSDKSLSSASDDSGNVWIAGETSSSGLGYLAHQLTYGGGANDGFVVKFNNAGGRIWASYYGGSGDEAIKSIKKDNTGNVLFTGSTTSPNNIAPTGSAQGIDAFVAKLDANGSRSWGFYYGDVGTDEGGAIAVDASNNLYLVGTTGSNNNISTNGTTLSGVYSAFIVKFNSSGVRQWGFYYGGAGLDFGTAIALDGAGNLWVGGKTSSTSGMTAGTVPWTTFNGGQYDAFLAKFDQTMTRLWGTYIVRFNGGEEEVVSIATDEFNQGLIVTEATIGSTVGSDIHTFATSGSYIADLTLPGLVAGVPCSIHLSDKKVFFAGTTNSQQGKLTYFPETGFQQVNGGNKDAIFYSYSTYRSMNDNFNTTFYAGGDFTITGAGFTIDASGNLFTLVSDGEYYNHNVGTRVKKYDSNGTLIWTSPKIGTAGVVAGSFIEVDPSGNIYVAGVAWDNPSGIGAGGFQQQFGGGVYHDGFLCKLDNLGNLLWSTFYGGTGTDLVKGLAVDGSSIYIVGSTNSTTNISSNSTQFAGGTSDAFAAKFLTGGSRSWGTYYGGTNNDGFNRIAITSSGELLVTGVTASSGMAYMGYQNSLSGPSDGLLVKFNSGGTRLWATYYGGLGYENLDGIDLDASGNIYAGGSTTSTSGIAFNGFQNSYAGGNGDLFLVKLSPSGSLLYGTYYGGPGDELNPGSYVPVTVDGSFVYVGGPTRSTTGISTQGIQPVLGGYSDGFLAKFSLAGERQWATYYGRAGQNEEFVDIRFFGTTIFIHDLTGVILRMPNPSSTGIAEPSNQPSAIVFSGITHNQITVSYTIASSLPDGYLVLRKAGSTPTATIVDGVSYPVNQTVGDATVVYSGSSLSFIDQGLTNNTTFYYKIYAYNGYGPTSNYNLTSPLSGSAATLTYAVEPTAQPTGFSATNISLYSMTVGYTAATGTPDGYLVLRKAGSSPTSNPVDGVTYAVGQALGDGTVIHTATGITVQSTSLSKSTAYYYKIFSFNGSGTARNYLVPSPLTGNATTLTYETQPGSQPTNLVLSPSVNSISVSFNYATVSPLPDGYLILRSDVGPPSAIPVDGTSYAVQTYLTDSWIISASGNNSITDIDLACETYYYYAVYAFRGSGTEINYLTVSPLSGYTITDDCPPPPCDPCPRVSFGPLTISSMWENGEAVVLWENSGMNETDALTLQRSLDGVEFGGIEPNWAVLSQSSKKATDLDAKNLPSETIYYRMRFTSRKSVQYSPAVSLQKQERLPDIRVSPNPADEYIKVSGPDIVAYDLMDATGRPLLSRAIPGQLSVKDLSPGLYLVRVYTATGRQQTVKLVLYR